MICEPEVRDAEPALISDRFFKTFKKVSFSLSVF
jgi:hypothetical protein